MPASTSRCISFSASASFSTTASGGRPPSLSRDDAHGAARCMEAEAEVACRLDRLLLQRRPVHIEILMVGRGRAAGEHELRHRCLRRDMEHLRRDPRPDRIMRLQPAEELGILPARRGARQALKHVVMRVDEARHQHMAGKIDHLVGCCRQLLRRPGLDDPVVLDIDPATGDLPRWSSIVTRISAFFRSSVRAMRQCSVSDRRGQAPAMLPPLQGEGWGGVARRLIVRRLDPHPTSPSPGRRCSVSTIAFSSA